MAHSNLQRMMREAMELDREITHDCDGDYPLRHGDATYFLSVGRGGHMVKIWSHAVFGGKHTAAVLREGERGQRAAPAMPGLSHRRRAVIEAFLPIEPLIPRYLGAVCCEVGTLAARIGPLMAAVHSGTVVSDFASEAA